MSYINSERHFLNVIKKRIKEVPDINQEKLLDAESYIDLIYSKKLTDKFTWELRENPYIVEEDNLLKWMQQNNLIGINYIPNDLEHIITAEFNDEIKQLSNVSGIYSFWSKSKIPLYIGVSIDLKTRIMSSFSERFIKYKKPIYFRYISTKTSTDAALLEIYFIGKLKPSLNGTSKYSDELTLQINIEPEFSKAILCNRIKKKVK